MEGGKADFSWGDMAGRCGRQNTGRDARVTYTAKMAVPLFSVGGRLFLRLAGVADFRFLIVGNGSPVEQAIWVTPGQRPGLNMGEIVAVGAAAKRRGMDF